jgi:hypothetical protein
MKCPSAMKARTSALASALLLSLYTCVQSGSCFTCCFTKTEGRSSYPLCTFCRPVQVAYGACCQPGTDEPDYESGNPSIPGPIYTATTESACRTLEELTAWVQGTPCNGSFATTCSDDIRGACCYHVLNWTDTCDRRECDSKRCEDDVTWPSCVEAHKRRSSEEGGTAVRYTAGTACAAVSCPWSWDIV